MPNQKGFTPALIIILIAVLGIGGYFVYSNSRTKTASSVNQTNPTPKPTESVSFADTTNWKRYTSSNLGFSIKYPAEVTLEEKDNLVLVSFWGPTQKANTEFYDGINLSFTSGSLKDKTLKEFADSGVEQTKLNGGVIVKPLLPFVLNGISGYAYQGGSQGRFTRIYLTSGRNQYFMISDGTVDPTEKGFQKITDQILSTFKFTQ